MTVIDSDILIRFLRGDLQARLRLTLLQQTQELACSVITVFEVLRGATPAQIPSAEMLLGSLIQLPVTEAIAREAANEWRSLRKQNVTLSLPDTLIGVTARTCGASLLSGNAKHFPLPGLSVISL
jgi:predicted nucleic acid-binding protein